MPCGRVDDARCRRSRRPCVPKNAPTKFIDRGHGQRDPRGQRPGRDRGRDGVGRVVEAVGVVEAQRQGDDDRRSRSQSTEGQDSLTAMLSTVLATFSNASAASSSSSTTSLSFSTVDRVVLAVEQLGQQPAVDLVGLVLEPVDLDPVLGEVLHRPQPRHRLGGQLGHRASTSTCSATPGGQLADAGRARSGRRPPP